MKAEVESTELMRCLVDKDGIVVSESFRPESLVNFMTGLFLHSSRLFDSWSPEAIANVLRKLTRVGGSEIPLALLQAEVDIEARVRCYEAVLVLFEQIFAKMCEPKTVHNGQTKHLLNIACFLWWDEFPTCVLDKGNEVVLQGKILDVMSQILKISSIPCQESAVHGLGHLWEDGNEQALAMLRDIASNERLFQSTREYALFLLGGGRI